MSKKVKYERTWCDYLTPCKHFENIEVGSYDCSRCKFHVTAIEKPIEERNPNPYFSIIKGIVKCNYEDKTM